jgi:hypothetical protein
VATYIRLSGVEKMAWSAFDNTSSLLVTVLSALSLQVLGCLL